MDSFNGMDFESDLLGGFDEFPLGGNGMPSMGGSGLDSPSGMPFSVGTPTGMPSLNGSMPFGMNNSRASGSGPPGDLRGRDNDAFNESDDIGSFFDNDLPNNNKKPDDDKNKPSHGMDKPPMGGHNNNNGGHNAPHSMQNNNTRKDESSINRGGQPQQANKPPPNRLSESNNSESLLSTLLMTDQPAGGNRPGIPGMHGGNQPPQHNQGHPGMNNYMNPRYSGNGNGMMMPPNAAAQSSMYGGYNAGPGQPRPPYAQHHTLQRTNSGLMNPPPAAPTMGRGGMPISYPTDYDQELAKLKSVLAAQPDLIPPPQDVLRVTQHQCLANSGRMPHGAPPGSFHPGGMNPGMPPGGMPSYRPPQGSPPPNGMMMETRPSPSQPPSSSTPNVVPPSMPSPAVVGRPQQPSPGQMAVATPGKATVWQSENDVPLRRKMIAKIVSLLQQRKPDAPAEWIRRLPDMARRLEDSLYRTASGREVYGNFATLKQRLQQLAVTMGARAAKSGMNTSQSTSPNNPAALMNQPPQRSLSMGNMTNAPPNHSPPNPSAPRNPQQQMQMQIQQQQQVPMHQRMQQQQLHPCQMPQQQGNMNGRSPQMPNGGPSQSNPQQQQQQQQGNNNSAGMGFNNQGNRPNYTQQQQQQQQQAQQQHQQQLQRSQSFPQNSFPGQQQQQNRPPNGPPMANNPNARSAPGGQRPSNAASSGRLSVDSGLNDLTADSPDLFGMDLTSSLMDGDGDLHDGLDTTTDFSGLLSGSSSAKKSPSTSPKDASGKSLKRTLSQADMGGNAASKRAKQPVKRTPKTPPASASPGPSGKTPPPQASKPKTPPPSVNVPK